MITTEALRKVTTVVTHANCPDGTASAILLADALPHAKVLFIRHGTEEYAKLPATPGMLFCDFTPPADRVQEFVDVGAIVLDHHKSARPVVDAFGDNGVFADESVELGVSGAVLAYRHVWKPLVEDANLIRDVSRSIVNARYFAELAGIRDTFDRRDMFKWAEACTQAEVLAFYPAASWLECKGPFTQENESWWADRMKLGELLIQKNAKKTELSVRDSFQGKTTRGRSYLIMQGVSTTDVGAITEGKIDIVVGFRYYVDNGSPKLQFSCRSQGVVDVGAIAKKYGGGGHTNASGFTVDFKDDDANVISYIRTLLEENGV